MIRAPVLLCHATLGALDYRMPAGMIAPLGSIVCVPLGPRRLVGVVWEADTVPSGGDVSDNRLRAVLSVYDVPPIGAPLRRLIEWTAHYYLSPPAAVLRMVLPSVSALEDGHGAAAYRLSGFVPKTLTPKRAQATQRIAEQQGGVRTLMAIADVSEAVIRGLIKSGVLVRTEIARDAGFTPPDPGFAPPLLLDEQCAVANRLIALVAAREFAPVLLDGVTGSGKTEVYFEAIAQALRDGRQVLVLLPEIALTAPFLRRFAARFGHFPVSWHSNLRQSQRRRAWRAIASGEALVTVGARSALFLPYHDLGLIIVDEAHETSFKQEEGVHYHARDVAVMRGQFENIPVILATATPALETRQQVASGRYAALTLPARYGAAQMPEITAIDLTQDPPERGRWIAPPLVRAVKEGLARGEQSLLFLNRRGFAPLTLCRHCGHRFGCPHCTSWMVEHRLTQRLQCHHCGHHVPPPRACPECHTEDALVACGPGVERIAGEAALLFPEARCAIVTSDTLNSPAQAAEFVEQMEAGDIDIVIGTQLVTKGYHFPDLTLVGVIDADLGLQGGDLRAAERSFQQIAQVAGRAGRAAKPGRVFVQTHEPDAPVIRALISGDAERFYAAETQSRKQAGAPPFGRFVAIIISSEIIKEAQAIAALISKTAPTAAGMHVYGPAPAPLAMLRGRHRMRLLVHAQRGLNIQDIIRDWLGALDWPRGVRVTVDVDPYNFM